MIKQNTIDRCTACASCVIECPVTKATGEFRGPKLLGPGQERFRLFENDLEASIDYCTNCKNCDITCPSNVPVSTLNMLAKTELYRKKGHRLRDWILSHGELFAKLGSPVAPLTNFGMNFPVTKAVLSSIGIANRPLPSYASKSFYQRFNAYKQKPSDKKVIFYPGCYIGYNTPQVGMDLVEILQANGIEVIVPDVVCCGTPVVSNGYMDTAREKAKHNIAELAKWAEKGYPILTCCTSCGLMLKQEYLELYQIDGAETVAQHHYDAGEYLLELQEAGKLTVNFTAPPGEFLYHAPCHMRAQGIGLPGFELLKDIDGMQIIEANAGCCGIAGSYGFKQEKYDISLKIGEKLFEAVQKNPDATVVTECGTCQLQIIHVTGRKVLHPISLLRQSMTN
ncbi:MAG: anaerobic glycerol-3-phosphate dehydrogenase subunit C [Sporomusaceae bacterium]|nr:anaerobic glycerol-3-phosphate dehydrogenase subunit C [Sporomusaceae bacterium]